MMQRVFLVIIFLANSGFVCYAQVSDETAKTIAMAATRRASKLSESELLRAHRREDLEDELFEAQLKIKGKIAKAAYFYEVTREGSYVLSPEEFIKVSSADGHFLRLVAVSTTTGQTYLLFGFDAAFSEFNRLSKESVLSINSTIGAENYARLCFMAVRDPSGTSIIRSVRDLKHQVENYFFFNYSEEVAIASFRNWWKGYSSRKIDAPFNLVASPSDRGYKTTIATITGSADRVPRFELWTIQVLSDGFCQETNTQIVYTTARRPRQGKDVN